jgi:molecular chaperone GrpE
MTDQPFEEQPGQTPAPDDSVDTADTAEIEALKAERTALQDRLLRTAAEFDNYRKRIDRERREQAESASTSLLTEILPVVDNLERALQAPATPELASYRAGVELIHRQLVDLLRKRGVTPIEALGVDFDPRVHQAVSQETSDAHRDGEVMEEMQRGYMLGERLLRPAMVKVAKS